MVILFVFFNIFQGLKELTTVALIFSKGNVTNFCTRFSNGTWFQVLRQLFWNFIIIFWAFVPRNGYCFRSWCWRLHFLNMSCVCVHIFNLAKYLFSWCSYIKQCLPERCIFHQHIFSFLQLRHCVNLIIPGSVQVVFKAFLHLDYTRCIMVNAIVGH